MAPLGGFVGMVDGALWYLGNALPSLTSFTASPTLRISEAASV
ncbi:MAG TPA: hypothetical protein VII70_08340 [Steroidobacteraceae bacterium]